MPERHPPPVPFDGPSVEPVVWTIGHSTRSFDVFVAMLGAWSGERLVDVRAVPKSKRHPQFNTDSLATSLPEHGVAYTHMPELGGFRKPRPDSPNTAWRNESFRGYADYMHSTEFEAALDRLLGIATDERIAIMCAEAVPWRCHRSLIADALTARDVTVRHIMSTTKADLHKLTPYARVDSGRVTYPAML